MLKYMFYFPLLVSISLLNPFVFYFSRGLNEANGRGGTLDGKKKHTRLFRVAPAVVLRFDPWRGLAGAAAPVRAGPQLDAHGHGGPWRCRGK